MSPKRDDAVALGKVIEARRDEMDYSRPELAKVAGISYPYLYEIERGSKYPSADALEKIATALEVPAQELKAEVAERLASPALAADKAPAEKAPARSHAVVARSEAFALESPATVAGPPPVSSGTFRMRAVDEVTERVLQKLEPVIREAVAEALKDVL